MLGDLLLVSDGFKTNVSVVESFAAVVSPRIKKRLPGVAAFAAMLVACKDFGVYAATMLLTVASSLLLLEGKQRTTPLSSVNSGPSHHSEMPGDHRHKGGLKKCLAVLVAIELLGLERLAWFVT